MKKRRPQTSRAIAWMPAQSVSILGTPVQGQAGVHLTFYTDVLRHATGEFDAREMRNYPEASGERLDAQEWLTNGNPRLLLLHENGWIFGQDYRGRIPDDAVDAEIDDATRQRILSGAEFWTRRFVAATWTIMGQRVAAKTPQHIPKTILGPAKQCLSIPPEIIFVDLRRVTRSPRDPEAETREVEWNHRWIVDGHWRNQYLPSTGSHRLQWIHPFVKGPEDRPLWHKDRVHRVKR